MNTDRCMKWDVVPSIDSPCADISLTYNNPDTVIVTMHFSHVKGLPSRDLVLTFDGAISLRWESETFGLNPLPEPTPRCTAAAWESWIFPLLKIEDSSWLRAHLNNNPVAAEGRAHFALVTMNDLLQVLALPEVKYQWVEAQ